MSVVKAKDLVPQAFKPAAADLMDREDDLDYDLGHLAAFDAHQVEIKKSGGKLEEELQDRARDAVQLLINRVFQLPTERSSFGPIAQLPAPKTRLPREKPVPEDKALTRWEKFALERGIRKRKKDRMAWDEAAQEWRPAWGYKRANDDSNDWAIEVGKNDDPFADKFEERQLAKKQRVIKNKMHQVKNLERADPAARLPTGIPVDMENPARKKGMKKAKAALRTAQRSTASMGKFDRAVDGEPVRKAVERSKLVTQSGRPEQQRAATILDNILHPKLKAPEGAGKGKGKGKGGDRPKAASKAHKKKLKQRR